jgi:hypothetical protein
MRIEMLQVETIPKLDSTVSLGQRASDLVSNRWVRSINRK